MKEFKTLDVVKVPLDGSSLIEASAGTGKTYAIANLYLRLILEKKMDVRSILVVTFTEAATKELRDRIRRNLSQAYYAIDDLADCENDTIRNILEGYLEKNSAESAKAALWKAVIDFDEAAIFTIHGFCKRMLTDNSFESAILFDTELITDQSAIIQEIADDFWRKTLSDRSALLGAIARKHRLGPAGLAEFSKEIINKPTLKILPHTATTSSEDIIGLFNILRDEWKSSAGDIKDILYNDEGLSRAKKTYKHEALDGYIEALEFSFFEAPGPASLGVIEMFSAVKIAGSMKKNKAAPEHRFFELCDAFLEAEQDFIIGIKLEYASFLKSELRRRKRSRNVQSFDDLLVSLRDSLKSERGPDLKRAIRKNFKAAMIDEFQDTDPVQYDIFDTLFNVNNHSLFLIGDPKQSIYRFRGADIFSYMDAASKARDDRKYTLETNWRSETSFVKAAGHLFGFSQNPFVLGRSISYYDVEAAAKSVGNKKPLTIEGDSRSSIVLWFLRGNNPSKDDARTAAKNAVTYEISRILSLASQGKAKIGDDRVLPSDIAILVTRNADAMLIKEALSRLNIPAVLKKTGNIFQTDEAEEVERLLLAVCAPGNARRINAALATHMIGFCAEDIRRFVEDESRLGDYERHVENFNEYNELWNTKGFFRMLRKFLSDYTVRKKLLKLSDGERRLTNVLHIAELIHRASVENRLGINGILSWIAEQRTAEEEKEEHELRLERDDEAVQILTVFKSKGLQYPIVFCPFMWQQGALVDDDDFTFHGSGSIYLDIGSPEWDGAHKALAGKENLSELVRLLYVAVTRAQNRCYITCGKIGKSAANALDYLFAGGMDKDEDIVAALIKKIKNLSEDDVCREIKKYTEKSRGTICLTDPVPADPEPYQVAGGNKIETLAVGKFSGKINTDWGIASYSLLTSGEGHGLSIHGRENIKRDEPTEQNLFSQSESASQKSFFSFPKGPVPGSCVHSIFEKLDFTDRDASSQKKLIYATLKDYGLLEPGGEDIDKNQRATNVYDMITKVLNAPLLPGRADFTLSKIPTENRVSEMGFYYPLKRIVPGTLKNIFKKCAGMPDFQNSSFPERIGDLEFSPVHGFMQGFIDLFFCFEGKYYLLDWKTNHLGNSYLDYSREKLQISMDDTFYNLQYYIYTVALQKYLESRILDYDYERHFGGVFYLFVRGITPKLPGNGIFFDLPSKELIEELCTLCE